MCFRFLFPLSIAPISYCIYSIVYFVVYILYYIHIVHMLVYIIYQRLYIFKCSNINSYNQCSMVSICGCLKSIRYSCLIPMKSELYVMHSKYTLCRMLCSALLCFAIALLTIVPCFS